MANSLEVRPPFLDPEFVAWSYALPDQAKLRKGQGKALLKQAMRPFLPNDLIDRPKMGFSMPIADWLRTDLRSDVEALGRNSHLANSGLVDSSVVQRLAREHLSGAFNHARPLWLIFVFAAFLKHAASQAAVLPQPAVA
jgi:asparagine synthase (glutamine-hydrolysing)